MRLMLFQIVLGASFLAVGCNGPIVQVHDELTGQWLGNTHVIVQWSQTKTIPVNLNISSDGSVTGKVGNAQLVGAKLISGRNNLMRSIDWGRDYIVKADLDGNIVAAEKIHRDRINIIFDLVDGKLVGGTHTSGLWIGGKNSMVFSTTNLILEKVKKRKINY